MKLSACADKNKTDSVKGKTMLIVKKFGGTSVGDKQRMYNVANRCIEEYKKGKGIIREAQDVYIDGEKIGVVELIYDILKKSL